jgi:hypothetical protein
LAKKLFILHFPFLHLKKEYNVKFACYQLYTKLSSLVEELRRALPNVKNRYALEAEQTKQAAGSQVMMDLSTFGLM